MQRGPPEVAAAQSGGPMSELPRWQQLSSREQQQLVSLMQNPSAFSQLLALQQAMLTATHTSTEAQKGTTHPLAPHLHANQPRHLEQQVPWMPQLGQASQFGQASPSYVIAGPAALQNLLPLNRPLPAPPQFDRSLLHAPLPYWTSIPARNSPANFLAAEVNANQRSLSGLDRPSPPLADFNDDFFRSSSLGSRYMSHPLPAELSAELSLRASSMPGSYHDIAARLHLNRAGITTATTSMIPVLSQDWLVIPFGTAQQLLPVSAGDVMAEPNGDAIMLIDEMGHNWPMKCTYSRAHGCFRLVEGWKPFAQRWSLGHGEQLQLSRCFVSGGCVWLDGKIARPTAAADAPAGKESSGKRKRGEADASADAASWAKQGIAQQPVAPKQAEDKTCCPGPTHSMSRSVSVDKQAEPLGAAAAKSPIISVKRLISCPTYCSRLHVNQHMAEHLLPLLPEMLNVKPPLPYTYQSLFKHKVKIVDENGEAWTVQYEGFVSAAQRHYRFTAGWTNLVKQKGIRVGDAVVLERWTADRFKLRMHIIKNASEDNIVAATISRGRAKRGPACSAQRVTKARSPNKRGAQAKLNSSPAARGSSNPGANPSTRPSSGQGYSPTRRNSSALEALHDAALLCANSASLEPEWGAGGSSRRNVAPNLDDMQGGQRVSAAAVAAADAAALKLDGSKLALAVGISSDQAGFVDHQPGHAVLDDRSWTTSTKTS